MTDERSSTPVEGNVTEQAVFDFIPLAGPRRKMTDCDLQTCLVGQFLQFNLPQPKPVSIASAGVGADQQPGSVPVVFPTHAVPPTTNAFHREARRVMITPHVDPTLISAHVIDPIGNRFALVRIWKVMGLDWFWLARGLPFAPLITVAADQLFFLGIHGNYRQFPLQEPLCPSVDVLKLSVTIRMLFAFDGFRIALQAIAQLVKDFANGRSTDRVSEIPQSLGQMSCALTCPS